MRMISNHELGMVTGGLKAPVGGINSGIAAPDVIHIPPGNGVSGGIFTTIYNSVKYSNWTPTEIAQDLFTTPGSTMTMTEAGFAAADIVDSVLALDVTLSASLGTVIYNNMSPSLQDAIGGTIYSAQQQIEHAFHHWQEDL